MLKDGDMSEKYSDIGGRAKESMVIGEQKIKFVNVKGYSAMMCEEKVMGGE